MNVSEEGTKSHRTSLYFFGRRSPHGVVPHGDVGPNGRDTEPHQDPDGRDEGESRLRSLVNRESLINSLNETRLLLHTFKIVYN